MGGVEGEREREREREREKERDRQTDRQRKHGLFFVLRSCDINNC